MYMCVYTVYMCIVIGMDIIIQEEVYIWEIDWVSGNWPNFARH